MTISGSGGGSGSLGTSMQPSVSEQEQTAATQLARTSNGMAIVKDTLSLSFYELGGQIGRYPANPDRPVLPPLISTRGSTGAGSDNGGNWQQALQVLVNLLPAAVQSDYQEQMALPLNQRNLNFVALDNVLTSTAMAMAWLQGASGSSPTEGVTSADAAINAALPYLALEAMVNFSGTVLAQGTQFLDDAGANYPQQDSLRSTARQLSRSSDEATDLQEQQQSTGRVPSEAYALLAANLATSADQYSRIFTGDDLSILGISLSAMASLTAALSVSDTANPLLYLALATSSIGLNTDDSAAGIVGPGLAATTDASASALTALTMPNASDAMQNLLNMVVTTTIISAVAFSSILNQGLGPMPQEDPAAAEAAQQFSAELATQIAVNSGVVSATISALVDTFGLAATQQQLMQNSLELMALTIMVLTSTPSSDPLEATSQFGAYQESIGDKLNALAESVSDGVSNQTFDSTQAASLSIALDQAQIALKDGNMDDFVNSLTSILTLAGTSDEQFMSDLGSIRNFVQTMALALTSGMNDQTNTDTMVNIIV